jgi:hypothetical protein
VARLGGLTVRSELSHTRKGMLIIFQRLKDNYSDIAVPSFTLSNDHGNDDLARDRGVRRRRAMQPAKVSQPRPEASCQNVVLQIYSSPDKALRASVLPTDVSLYATPDIESRLTRRPIPWFSSVTVFGLLAAKCGHSDGSK